MPTYEYACTSCGERLEVVQRFSDEPLTQCPACAGALRKVFSPVGVVFKGSGFYKTDSRGSIKSSSASGKDAASSSPDSTSTSDKTPSSTGGDSGSAGSSSSNSSTTDSKAGPAKDSKPAGGSGERVA